MVNPNLPGDLLDQRLKIVRVGGRSLAEQGRIRAGRQIHAKKVRGLRDYLATRGAVLYGRTLQGTFMRRFIHRHQPKAHPRVALLAGLGTALAIGGMAFVNDVIGLTVLMAPLGATCVLLFAAPQSPLSQPVNVIGGHMLAAAVGLGLHFAIPGSFWMAGLAVGLAVAAMVYLRIVHPPAGATALIAYLTAVSWSFLLFPVALGSVALVAVATFYHRLMRTPYPAPLP